MNARRLLSFALLLAAVAAPLAPAFAQAPPPVPVLPDAERRTSYTITGTTCACGVGFALYGDSTDYQDWVEVWLNGVRVNYNDATYGWTITSQTGPLGTIPRPITDGVLNFNSVQAGTVQIVGARRPRRVSQFQENRGVAARDQNQALTDIIATEREFWDKINDMTGRGIFAAPGTTLGTLPTPCVNGYIGFDATGLNPICVPVGTLIPDPLTTAGGGSGGTSWALNLPLLGGGGTAPFKQGTVSGNTTDFGTVSGALTPGHCLSIDSHGNIIDSGGTCGSGSAGVGSITVGSTPLTGAVTLQGTSSGQQITGMTFTSGYPWADINGYGAKCNSQVDDTTAVQNAMNYEDTQDGPGIINVPIEQGFCCVRGGIVVPGGIRIHGASPVTSAFSACGSDVTVVTMPEGKAALDTVDVYGKGADTYLAVRLTGTKTTGDQPSITVTSSAVTGSPVTVSYTVLSGDTLATIAAGLATAINNNTALAAASFAASSSSYGNGVFVEILNNSVGTLTVTSGSTVALTDWTFGASAPAIDAHSGCVQCYFAHITVGGGTYGIWGPPDGLVFESHFSNTFFTLAYITNGSWWIRNQFDSLMPQLPTSNYSATITGWQANHSYSGCPCFATVVQPDGPQAGITFYIETISGGNSGATVPKLQNFNYSFVDGSGPSQITWQLYDAASASSVYIDGGTTGEVQLMETDSGGTPYGVVITDGRGAAQQHVRWGPDNITGGTMQSGIDIRSWSDIDIFDSEFGGGWIAGGAGVVTDGDFSDSLRIHDNIIWGGGCPVEITTGTNINIHDNQIFGATIAGVCVSGGSHINVHDNMLGTSAIYGTNAKPFALTGAADYVSVAGNDTYGATSGFGNTSSGAHNLIINNLGTNPIGPGSSATTVGTSPATICAGPTPETHYYLQSATNTATVKINSVTVGTMVNAVIPVVVNDGANECEVVTWATTAPTYQKVVH